MRLSDDLEAGGAINYLFNCFKRLQAKLSTSNEKIKEELIGSRDQIVSFMVSALTVPEMFEKNSENSVSDLVRVLGTLLFSFLFFSLLDFAIHLSCYVFSFRFFSPVLISFYSFLFSISL